MLFSYSSHKCSVPHINIRSSLIYMYYLIIIVNKIIFFNLCQCWHFLFYIVFTKYNSFTYFSRPSWYCCFFTFRFLFELFFLIFFTTEVLILFFNYFIHKLLINFILIFSFNSFHCNMFIYMSILWNTKTYFLFTS